jgi:hypothetical protein
MIFLKRLIATLFIVLILFNVLGYYALLVGLQYKNTVDTVQQLNVDKYNKADAITVKIPMPVPDALESQTFERVNGDFEYNGEVYRLVKQRLYLDTFRIVCVKDKTATAIRNTITTCVKTFGNEPVDDDAQETKALPIFIKEYLPRIFSIEHLSYGWKYDILCTCSLPRYIDTFDSSITHPPQQA